HGFDVVEAFGNLHAHTRRRLVTATMPDNQHSPISGTDLGVLDLQYDMSHGRRAHGQQADRSSGESSSSLHRLVSCQWEACESASGISMVNGTVRISPPPMNSTHKA